jgi:hypothetical protein
VPESPFSAAAIARSVHDTLDEAQAAIPADAKTAILLDGTYTNGHPQARALYVQRLEHGWSTALEAAWQGPHDYGGKVAVMKVWK